jgi:hypothetical protein
MAVIRGLVACLGAVLGGVLLLPVLAMAVLLWMVSAGTRSLRKWSVLEPSSLSFRDFVEYDRTVGWVTRRGLDAHVRSADDVFRVRTDEEGWRGPVSIDESTVVVLGDSFAFGYGVDDLDHYAAVDPSAAIKPVAVPGYNPVQELLVLRSLAPRLRGKLVVWLIYLGNDLFETVRPHSANYRAPFVRQTTGDAWEITSAHVTPAPWGHSGDIQHFSSEYITAIAALSCPGPLVDRTFSALRQVVRSGSEALAAEHADLVVVSAPHVLQLGSAEDLRRRAPEPAAFDVHLPDERLGQICRDLSIDFVPLRDRLAPRHYLAADRHWNAEGHRVFAETLAVLAESRRRRTLRTQWNRPRSLDR